MYKKLVILVIENKSVIGKRIKVKSNSYITRLDRHVDNIQCLYGKEFIIISEPYRKQVHKGCDIRIYGECYKTMVKVKSPRTGYEYEIMFEESWLVD